MPNSSSHPLNLKLILLISLLVILAVTLFFVIRHFLTRPPVPEETPEVPLTWTDITIPFSVPDALDNRNVDQVIVTGEGNFNPRFPSVVQADNGTLIASFGWDTSHALYWQSEGKLTLNCSQIVRSYDGGKTWTEREVFVDLSDGGKINRNTSSSIFLKFDDGTIMAMVNTRDEIPYSTAWGDYWYGRVHYMVSTDHGETWTDPQLLPCEHLSQGGLDYPNGCWMLGGSFATFEDGDFIIPVYGGQDCTTRDNLKTVLIRGHHAGNGVITWYDDEGDNVVLTDRQSDDPDWQDGDETALVAIGDTVYAMCRVALGPGNVNSILGNPNGKVYVSYDRGFTWELYAKEDTSTGHGDGNGKLNQPGLLDLGDGRIFVTYAIPMGASKPANGRASYGKLFDPKLGWDYYAPVELYNNPLTADVGDPEAILLNDGRIFVVYYDVNKRIVGGHYLTVDMFEIPAELDPDALTIDAVALEKEELALGENTSLLLKTNYGVAVVETLPVQVYTNNPGVVSVSKNGTVTAVGLGKATVTVRRGQETYTLTVCVTK